MAAVSGAFVIHGVRTVIAPYRPRGLDFLGTELSPTMVGDGSAMAPGLGARGRW
jgi:hypothetical protein